MIVTVDQIDLIHLDDYPDAEIPILLLARASVAV
jgi:hypothetical protein